MSEPRPPIPNPQPPHFMGAMDGPSADSHVRSAFFFGEDARLALAGCNMPTSTPSHPLQPESPAPPVPDLGEVDVIGRIPDFMAMIVPDRSG